MLDKRSRIPWSEKLIVVGWRVFLGPIVVGCVGLAAASLYFLYDDPRGNWLALAMLAFAVGLFLCFVKVLREEGSFRRLEKQYADESEDEELCRREPIEESDDAQKSG